MIPPWKSALLCHHMRRLKVGVFSLQQQSYRAAQLFPKIFRKSRISTEKQITASSQVSQCSFCREFLSNISIAFTLYRSLGHARQAAFCRMVPSTISLNKQTKIYVLVCLFLVEPAGKCGFRSLFLSDCCVPAHEVDCVTHFGVLQNDTSELFV